MQNAALEAAIIESPDDPAGYLVYADWLQQQGDPRGEMIVIFQRDRERGMDVVEASKATLLGAWADKHPETFELEWQFGFIKAATIGWEMYGSEDTEDATAELAAFLALPAARFIQTLAIGPSADEEEMSLQGFATAIEAAAPPCLRKLYLGHTGDWDISSTSSGMPRSASIQAMRDLTIRGGQISLDEQIDLPNLTSFTVETGGLDKASVRAIATARWPNLEALEIWFGEPNYGGDSAIEDIKEILAGTGLTKLRKLGLRNCAFADEVALALIAAPVTRQLTALDLSMGNLSDRGLGAMLAAQQVFAHLDTLSIDDNALTDAHWPAARVLAKTVTFGVEQTPERADPSMRYRFVSVGE